MFGGSKYLLRRYDWSPRGYVLPRSGRVPTLHLTVAAVAAVAHGLRPNGWLCQGF